MQLFKIAGPVLLVSLVAGCAVAPENNAPVYNTHSTTVYTVQPGDTLYSISRRYAVDPKIVARDNNITNPSKVYPGQRLSISVYSRTASQGPHRGNPPPAPSASVKPVMTPAVAATPVVPTRTLDVTTPTANGSTAPDIFVWPAQGPVLKGFSETNKGVDIGGKEGDRVRAADAGKVIYVGEMRGYGKLVIINHNPTYVTAYGHNKSVDVKQGDAVKKGQPIATMGKTPDGGPKVHFEIRKVGKPIDPTTMLPHK